MLSDRTIEFRTIVSAISMTASDLSASTKPWDIQVQTVKVIFEEFYQQGTIITIFIHLLIFHAKCCLIHSLRQFNIICIS